MWSILYIIWCYSFSYSPQKLYSEVQRESVSNAQREQLWRHVDLLLLSILHDQSRFLLVWKYITQKKKIISLKEFSSWIFYLNQYFHLVRLPFIYFSFCHSVKVCGFLFKKCSKSSTLTLNSSDSEMRVVRNKKNYLSWQFERKRRDAVKLYNNTHRLSGQDSW